MIVYLFSLPNQSIHFNILTEKPKVNNQSIHRHPQTQFNPYTHTHLSILYTKLQGYTKRNRCRITKKIIRMANLEGVGWMLLRVRAYNILARVQCVCVCLYGWYCLKCHYIWYSEKNLEQVDIGVLCEHATQGEGVFNVVGTYTHATSNWDTACMMRYSVRCYQKIYSICWLVAAAL